MINKILNPVTFIIILLLIINLLFKIKIELFTIQKKNPDTSYECIYQNKCKSEIKLYWDNLKKNKYTRYIEPIKSSWSVKPIKRNYEPYNSNIKLKKSSFILR
jgi:hypothetical protein